MKLRFTQTQAILIRVLIIPPLIIKLAYSLIERFQPSSVILLVAVTLLILALKVDQWVAPRLCPPDQQKGQVFWINQSVSVTLPEGWAIASQDGLIVLNHSHTGAVINIRTRQLSPAQIREKILHKLDAYYNE